MAPFALIIVVLSAAATLSQAQLSRSFYDDSCPLALTMIRTGVLAAVLQERRMGASLLRLHFHDCFVQGCDASCLLDDTSGFVGEKTAGPNANSLRGFDVIDNIKSTLELLCPNTVSCADIIAVAARDAVSILGGPTWDVPLGRRDSTTASLSLANSNLPSPSSSLASLTSSFANQGLNQRDMVVLSGAHTIGFSHCRNFRSRLFNDGDMNQAYASSLKSNCPANGNGDNILFPIDVATPTAFDNSYYRNLLSQRGLLHSDQELLNNGSADGQSKSYAASQAAFFNDFAAAMVKMGNIGVLTGSAGEVRVNCRMVN